MNRKRDITVICIVLLGLLAGVALSHGFTWIFVQAGWDDRPIAIEQLQLSTLIGYGLAFVGAVFTIKNPRTFTLANEVVEELSKVTWPSKEETSNATVVVIVTVVVASLYLGIFDAVWMALTNWVLGVHGATPG